MTFNNDLRADFLNENFCKCDECGNRPCENGATCDLCMTDMAADMVSYNQKLTNEQ